jgi:hypothetical protein
VTDGTNKLAGLRKWEGNWDKLAQIRCEAEKCGGGLGKYLHGGVRVRVRGVKCQARNLLICTHINSVL